MYHLYKRMCKYKPPPYNLNSVNCVGDASCSPCCSKTHIFCWHSTKIPYRKYSTDPPKFPNILIIVSPQNMYNSSTKHCNLSSLRIYNFCVQSEISPMDIFLHIWGMLRYTGIHVCTVCVWQLRPCILSSTKIVFMHLSQVGSGKAGCWFLPFLVWFREISRLQKWVKITNWFDQFVW